MNRRTPKMPQNFVPLRQLATARSGDKGNHANVGVVARSVTAYELLVRELTAERVQQYFAGLGVSRVDRYELSKVHSLNFVLIDALAGGASTSLRIDTQGKLLGTALLDLELPCPAGFLPAAPGDAAYNSPAT